MHSKYKEEFYQLYINRILTNNLHVFGPSNQRVLFGPAWSAVGTAGQQSASSATRELIHRKGTSSSLSTDYLKQ